jgi:hypothetical protein
MVACRLLHSMTSIAVYSWYVHSSSSLVKQYGVASDQVQGVGYFEYEVETNTAGLKLGTNTAASGHVVS